MFLTLAIAAAGSVTASPALWLLALITLAIAYALIPASADAGISTPIRSAVLFLAAWIAITNKWASPAYTPAAPYHAMFIFGGFLLGRRAGAPNARRLLEAALAFALCLAGWAFWQRIHGEPRAHALFETPAILAFVLNLALLPSLVLASFGPRRSALVLIVTVLIAALAASTSRGGWLAFLTAVLAAAVFARRFGFTIDRGVRAVVVGSIVAGLAAAWLIPEIFESTLGATQSADADTFRRQAYSMSRDDAVHSPTDRLGMYELALRNLAPASFATGIGYLGFYYIMEAGHQAIANIQAGIAYFVHNDYLQTLLELGIPGCAALLTLAILPPIQAWRAQSRVASDRDKSLVLIALVAPLVSMATHALLDFPFYIPICLLIYGAMLGTLDALLVRPLAVEIEDRRHTSFSSLRQAAIAAASAFVAWTLITPVAAEGAAHLAQHQWRFARGESAAYWFEVARRLEPRDWRYHWYAGQFWFAQAAQNRNREAARLADKAFADGYRENSKEVRNLLGRITTHRELGALLSTPADGPMLLGWVKQAVQMAPNDQGVRLERDLVLKKLGSKEQRK